MPPLEQVQRWLQSAIVSPAESTAADRHIAPSSCLTAAERLGIYRELYPARLVAALKLDYPLLCDALGGAVFTQLALYYAQAHPSRSFTLNEFGRRLPDFLPEVKGLRRPAFLRDLAQFERACSDVFHEAEVQSLTSTAIAAIPATAWHRARLQPIPALRLLALDHPVHRYAEGATAIKKSATYLVIYRRHFEVCWRPVTPTGFRVLTSLTEGHTLDKALRNARGPVQQWFQDWMAAGLFQSATLLQRPGTK